MQVSAVPDTVRILQDLLQAAEVPNGQTGPILLCHENIDAGQIAEVCVVKSDKCYPKQADSGHAVSETICGDEYVKSQLALGFRVMSMFIGNSVYGGGVHHDVVTVLVKLKTN
jgi:hypothetical protein